MSTADFPVISWKKLDSLFYGRSVGQMIVFESIRCVGCGESVNIKIQKTSGGYGFLNGIISEPSRGQLLAKCSKCNGYKEG